MGWRFHGLFCGGGFDVDVVMDFDAFGAGQDNLVENAYAWIIGGHAKRFHADRNVTVVYDPKPQAFGILSR
jgi:hypothetical protein